MTGRHQPLLLVLLGAVGGFLMAFINPSAFTIQETAEPQAKGNLTNPTQAQNFDCKENFPDILDAENVLAEAVEKKIRVFCWVMTGPQFHKSRSVHIKVRFNLDVLFLLQATWLQRCTSFAFMSSEADEDLPAIGLNVTEGRNHLWSKVQAAWKYIYDNHLASSQKTHVSERL